MTESTAFPPPSGAEHRGLAPPWPPGAPGPTGSAGWVERPWAANGIGFVAYLIPFVASIFVAFALSDALPQAPNLIIGAIRWLGIAAVSTVALALVERQTRRLLPLRTLLGLTLAFPDHAPSRFKIAIRTGTTHQLRSRLAEARDGKLGDTPSEAAVRLLELVGMLSQHDRLTRGHSERVRAYCHLIGEEMGMSGDELDRLRWAGLLHDVGKLAISPEILNKPTKLTDEEYDLIKTHPMEGKKLVEPLAAWLGDASRAVWEHHERFDGGGYPQGLAGSDISMAARIVSVADVFDVMTSIRTYKPASSASEARKELADCAGTQFDPDVVKAFLAISVSRVRSAMGPLSWIAQLALFPVSVAAQSAPTFAAAAAMTAGAAAGTVGMVASPEPIIADQTVQEFVREQPVEQIDDPVQLLNERDRPAPTVPSTVPVLIPESSTIPRPVVPPTPSAPSTTPPTPSAPTPAPAAVAPPTTAVPATTTTTAAPTPATTTTIPAATTTTTTTSTTTTSTTLPAIEGGRFLFLMPSGSGDTPSQAELPLGIEEPAEIELPNYDTDRDGDPGLLIQKDAAGVGGLDPSKVQIFAVEYDVAGRNSGDMRVELYVAAKDFARADIHVAVMFQRCDSAGWCTTLGYGEKVVSNATRFKRVNLALGEIDLVVQPGDRLQLRVANLDDSSDDMWLAFGTDDYDSRLVLAG